MCAVKEASIVISGVGSWQLAAEQFFSYYLLVITYNNNFYKRNFQFEVCKL